MVGVGGGEYSPLSVLRLFLCRRAAINLGCFSSFKISKFIHRRSCLYSSPVKTMVVRNKCSKDQ